MYRTMNRVVLAGLLLVLVSACAGTAPTPEPKAAVAQQETAPVPPPPRRRVADDVRDLLSAAEAALAADRLTTPLHDNAFDRFQAVLLLDPGNAQARSGIQQIFARYVSMIRTALNRSDPGRARALLERARLVQHESPLLDELDADITRLWQRVGQQNQNGGDAADNEITLDVRSLDRRSLQLVEQLKELARQVQESDETLLIIARNDAEGRWIYQRMSEGVPDYRLRGDIQLGRTPKILILPPID